MEESAVDKFKLGQCLIAPNNDETRVVGIRLSHHAFRHIAFLILGNWDAVNLNKSVLVESINLLDPMGRGLPMWHIQVGNALIDISPEQVMYRFDMPLPKEDRGPDWKESVE